MTLMDFPTFPAKNVPRQKTMAYRLAVLRTTSSLVKFPPYVWTISAIKQARRASALRKMPDHLLRDIGLDDHDINLLKPPSFNNTSDDPQTLRLR